MHHVRQAGAVNSRLDRGALAWMYFRRHQAAVVIAGGGGKIKSADTIGGTEFHDPPRLAAAGQQIQQFTFSCRYSQIQITHPYQIIGGGGFILYPAFRISLSLPV